MKLRYIPKKKLKVITGLFFAAGGLGIYSGLTGIDMSITTIGTVFICIGGLTGWMFFTQEPRLRDKRKKKRDDN